MTLSIRNVYSLITALLLGSTLQTFSKQVSTLDCIKAGSMIAKYNLKQSTPWDWAITLGSACGAAHGLYNNRPDQAVAWLISTFISLTGQLTQLRLPLRMARFVAAAILVSYRTDILAKIAKTLYEQTDIKVCEQIHKLLSDYPELCGAIAGITAKLMHGVNKY